MQTCVWTLTATPGQVLQLDFTAFSTESHFDFVTIFDGPSTSSPILASVSGGSLTQTWYRSTGGVMFIRFATDQSVTSSGFSATFTSVDSTSPRPSATTGASATATASSVPSPSYTGVCPGPTSMSGTGAVYIMGSQ